MRRPRRVRSGPGGAAGCAGSRRSRSWGRGVGGRVSPAAHPPPRFGPARSAGRPAASPGRPESSGARGVSGGGRRPETAGLGDAAPGMAAPGARQGGQSCPCPGLRTRLPVLRWLPRYSLAWLQLDLIAGLTVGLTAVPQALAYAEVAGLPLQVGGRALWTWVPGARPLPDGGQGEEGWTAESPFSGRRPFSRAGSHRRRVFAQGWPRAPEGHEGSPALLALAVSGVSQQLRERCASAPFVPVQYGLYSSFMGCFVYCFLGTAKDVTLGPTAIMSLLVSSYAFHEPVYAILLAFLSGCIQLAMGLLHLGETLLPSVVVFLGYRCTSCSCSRPVLSETLGCSANSCDSSVCVQTPCAPH